MRRRLGASTARHELIRGSTRRCVAANAEPDPNQESTSNDDYQPDSGSMVACLNLPILELGEQGLSERRIAEALGVSKSSVHRLLVTDC